MFLKIEKQFPFNVKPTKTNSRQRFRISLACRAGVFYEMNACLTIAQAAILKASRKKVKPIVLSLGIIFCLAPTLCQFHYSRWRHIGLFIARPGYSSLAQQNTPALQAIFRV